MPGETTEAAAKRRLQEEMGMQCELSKSFSFIYKAHLDHELTEFEFDHVYKGRSDAEPMQNNEEVAAWKYISVADLQTDIQLHPEKYTEWFKICIKDYIDNLIS
jgi:isopentenyl-diphosphate delta-isomerase